MGSQSVHLRGGFRSPAHPPLHHPTRSNTVSCVVCHVLLVVVFGDVAVPPVGANPTPVFNPRAINIGAHYLLYAGQLTGASDLYVLEPPFIPNYRYVPKLQVRGGGGAYCALHVCTCALCVFVCVCVCLCLSFPPRMRYPPIEPSQPFLPPSLPCSCPLPRPPTHPHTHTPTPTPTHPPHTHPAPCLNARSCR